MEKKEQLIYDLIFSDKTDFKIDVGDFIDDIYKYETFIVEMKDILRKSKVTILNHAIDVDSKTVTWKLKVKK